MKKVSYYVRGLKPSNWNEILEKLWRILPYILSGLIDAKRIAEEKWRSQRELMEYKMPRQSTSTKKNPKEATHICARWHCEWIIFRIYSTDRRRSWFSTVSPAHCKNRSLQRRSVAIGICIYGRCFMQVFTSIFPEIDADVQNWAAPTSASIRILSFDTIVQILDKNGSPRPTFLNFVAMEFQVWFLKYQLLKHVNIGRPIFSARVRFQSVCNIEPLKDYIWRRATLHFCRWPLMV